MRMSSLLGRAAGTATTLLLLAGAVGAQSGRGMMHGYVAFEDVAYQDVATRHVQATIELHSITEGSQAAYTIKTDEHGLYDLKSVLMGEYRLRIVSPGYRVYQTEIYIPSDFECRLAIRLKRDPGKPTAAPPKKR